jgi:hypothetical protein
LPPRLCTIAVVAGVRSFQISAVSINIAPAGKREQSETWPLVANHEAGHELLQRAFPWRLEIR